MNIFSAETICGEFKGYREYWFQSYSLFNIWNLIVIFHIQYAFVADLKKKKKHYHHNGFVTLVSERPFLTSGCV